MYRPPLSTCSRAFKTKMFWREPASARGYKIEISDSREGSIVSTSLCAGSLGASAYWLSWVGLWCVVGEGGCTFPSYRDCRGSRASKLQHWMPAESKESVRNIGKCVSWQPRRTSKTIAVKRREQLKCEMRLCSDEPKRKTLASCR